MATTITVENKTTPKTAILLGNVAFAAGALYAFKNKTGFWKGWGIAIIFSVAGYGIGYGIDAMKK